LALTVRRLEPDDDRSGFQSGNIELDRFFIRYAGQNQFRHHLGTTYVAVDDDGSIAGFVTVTASELAPSDLPRKRSKALPRYPVPVLRLARLAVDRRVAGRGVGSVLVQWLMLLAQRMAGEIGCVGILVDAKPESLSFYEKLGFEPLQVVAGQLGDRPSPSPMFLPLGTIPRTR
jgi:GNAT superfamily N-acetyltransferase